MWAPNLPEWAILEYAAALAGLLLVTVNPAYRPAELAYVLNQSGAAGIFLVRKFRSPMAAFLAEVRPGDIAQIQYTSGTTGFPTCGAAFPAWRRAILMGNIGLSP